MPKSTIIFSILCMMSSVILIAISEVALVKTLTFMAFLIAVILFVITLRLQAKKK